MGPWPCVPEAPCSLGEHRGGVLGAASLLPWSQPCNEGDERANEADGAANESAWAEGMMVLSSPSL